MNQLLEANPLVFYNVAGIGAFIGFYFLLRNRSIRAKMIFLYTWCIGGILVLAVYLTLQFFIYKEHPLTLFPLHLCYLSLIFTLIALKTKIKVFFDFIFYISLLGALFAIIFPSIDYIDGMFSLFTVTYFLLHYHVVAFPLWLFAWRIYSPKISLKKTFVLVGVLLSLDTIMYLFNTLLIKNDIPKANYFWTMMENGSYNNTLLAFFARLIPYDFVYMLPCIFILCIYIGAWNIPIFLKNVLLSKKQYQ